MEMQKCLHLHLEEAKKKPKIQGEYIVSEKKDGWFVAVDYIGEKWYTPRSSAERFIPSMAYTRKFWEKLPKPRNNCRFIAEAVIPGLDFHTTNGIFNRKSEDALDVEFFLHDFIDFTVSEPALTRYNRLKGLDLTRNGKIHLLEIIDITEDRQKWYNHAEDVWEKEGEGVVLKKADAVYQPGERNSSLMKIKLEAEFDLLCIDMWWQTGDKGQQVLMLKLKNLAGIVVPVRVSKHSDQVLFMERSPVGGVCKIKCMKKLKDGSYREPRFVCHRPDKKPTQID